MSTSDKEQEYLKLCNECEVLSLEISRAYKALSEKKTRLDEMDMRRKQLRTELVGLLEEPTKSPVDFGGGVLYKPKGFA